MSSHTICTGIYKISSFFPIGLILIVLGGSREPLKTHFPDATCHVDDNISKSNQTKCDFKQLQMSLCMILIRGAARHPVSRPAGRQHQPFPAVSVSMAALIRCDYWGQGPIRGHLRVKRVVQYNSGTSRPDPASLLATGTAPHPEPWEHPSRWWLRLQGSILFSSASIHPSPITWPRWINLNNGNRGSVKRSPLSTRGAVWTNVQFTLFLAENNFNAK